MHRSLFPLTTARHPIMDHPQARVTAEAIMEFHKIKEGMCIGFFLIPAQGIGPWNRLQARASCAAIMEINKLKAGIVYWKTGSQKA